MIKTVKPDVVLGMGGYASAPGGLAAWLMKTPLVVHEQNAAAGLTNRLLSRIAQQVCSAFPNVFVSKVNAQVVGNPIRASIGERKTQAVSNNDKERNTQNILVVGGSLGAQVLNQVLPECFATLISNKATCNIWHQTGKGKQAQVIAAYNQHHVEDEQVRVTEFIEDMASAYQWADIVICRAGALTVSELAMAAKPAIFVPLPHAVDDHQTKNAQYLVACGGATMIKQSDLTSEGLANTLSDLLSEKQILRTMAKAAFEAADVNATEKVAGICQQMLSNNKQQSISSEK